MAQRNPKKENKNDASLHLFSPAEGMTVLQTIQSWRGDPRLDEWQEHFLASLAHRMYVAGREFDLSADQVEKLEEIREIITGFAPPARPTAHPDDIEGEIVDWSNEGGRPERETDPRGDHWQHAQRAAKRRVASGAPLASNFWWEKRHVV